MLHASPEMQAYYAARAPYYDAVYLKPERKDDIAYLAAYLPKQLKALSVIEVACGTGYWTQHIAGVAKSLVATDGTAEPLQFAKLRPNTENTLFRQADAYALPADLGQFEAAFAGLWFSHVPVRSRPAFFQSLHALLLPGARVIMIDNSEVQCQDFPIVERDVDGNSYQLRELRDGSQHRVLKNFPTNAELVRAVESFSSRHSYQQLDNFWLFEYELKLVG